MAHSVRTMVAEVMHYVIQRCRRHEHTGYLLGVLNFVHGLKRRLKGGCG